MFVVYEVEEGSFGQKCLEIGSGTALFLPVTFLGIAMASSFYYMHDRVGCLLEVGSGSLSVDFTLCTRELYGCNRRSWLKRET